jgi:NTE family protein
MKKVHLVLGSGGARGMAHIGVIEMLQQDGYEIVEVIGCSMGAVVGAMFCAGYLNDYKNWLLSLTKSGVFSLFDLTLTMQGFVKGEKIFHKLQEFTGHQNIEDLKIPFTAVATDMVNKKEVYFTSGNIYKALRASIAIPGVFTPVVNDHSVLVDGGVLNPLPVNLIHKQQDAIVVAVNLNGAPMPTAQVNIKETEGNNYWEWLSKFPIVGKKEHPAEQKSSIPKFTVFDLLNTSYDFTMDRLTELMIQYHHPDILIEVPRNSCNIFEFYRAKDVIEIGKNAYKKAVENG